MPSSRPEKVEDFILDGAHRRVALLANGYPLVRKDLRGCYPKHYWPDDPLTAVATRRVRPR